MPEITIYTRNSCGPCRAVKHWLSSKNFTYNEKNIDNNPELVDEMIRTSGMQIVPLTIINGEPVMGMNIGRINSLLTN